ncbi:quinoprotein dehydrogenase-associated SoxYZ-like carrier [Profundibacter amoris]|uniref:Quinoprotein dehydrogenase-associated SoxYZ-like carrier n=1 Tax=Profundibacter amoris TaxID=2171755 RepID=A0A347UCV8_9RHOB|nr:quinoprotein dehydrogenase-associated SoxYZ-like carrier [Profundibacter amoris]AXX96686.1 quinoprotein dehydrogenase-associated SoxYZ-like carrier [Profundibacter amoris]
MLRSVFKTIIATAALAVLPSASIAGEAWDDISPLMFDEARDVTMASAQTVTLRTPYRATDDRRVMMGASVALPDGQLIDKVYLVIDENPMPVSAVFEMQRPTGNFTFDMTMRLNGPSGIHLVVETTDGQLLVSEGFTKTSGLGACAAPPVNDPAIALKTLGQMKLALAPANTMNAKTRLVSLASGTKAEPQPVKAQVSFSHPSHSGLQMNQITLLYLPARFIEMVKFTTDESPMFTMTGSISISEDPALSVVLPAGSGTLSIDMQDTDGATFHQLFSLGQG